jgi:hypothetical protein
MKRLNWLWLFFFILSPFIVYGYDLEPQDIDIFCDSIGNIFIGLEEVDEYQNLREYHALGASVSEKFEALWSDVLTDEELNELPEQYKKFINFQPQEYKHVFTEAGWKKDGHKKFFIIFFGAACVYFYLNEAVMEEDLQMRRAKLLSIFDEHDLDMISDRMDDLIFMF